jgi:spore coat-associated protein N
VLKATLAMFLATGIIGSFVAVDSLAVFTDQKTNGANQFDTGSISLADAPASALVTFVTMAPGDLVIQPLTLTNSGTLDLRYSMTAAATNVDAKALKDQLVLTVRLKTVNPCTNEDGAIIAGPGPLSAGAFGSSVQGAQAGDRPLVAAAVEILCFKVQLPLTTGNAYQNATTTATFTFDAEQTRNNP